MNLRRLAASLLLVALAALCIVPAHAAPYRVKQFVLFGGGTFDSTTHCSPWIPVKGANHVVIRSWTMGTSAATDSQYVDSLATIQFVFADSVSFMARDSAGVRVTASSAFPRSTAYGEAYPICTDSTLITPVGGNETNSDSTTLFIGVQKAPVRIALRSAAVGGGKITRVYGIPPNSIGAYGDGEIHKGYMRVNCTPARRFTANTPADVEVTSCSTTPTCGARANGMLGFRMIATVYYNDETH